MAPIWDVCLMWRQGQASPEGLVPKMQEGCSQEMAVSFTWGPMLQYRIPRATGGAFACKQQSLWGMTVLRARNSLFLQIYICCYPATT